MLSTIIRACAARPRLVVFAALVLFAFGIGATVNAKYDVFPGFVPTEAAVQTEAPGLSAAQVEQLVTRPLEDVINGAIGIASVRSESIQGLSVIIIVFQEGSDPFRARQVVAEQLAEAANRLPGGVGTPRLTPLVSSTKDLLKIGFTSDRLSTTELRDLVQWTVRPRLLAVPGVAQAMIFGGGLHRVEVRVRPEALFARHLTLADVTAAVRAATAIRGGGYVDTPSQHILIEPDDQNFSAALLSQAVVSSSAGTPLRLADIADVADATVPAFGQALVMGRPGLVISMTSQYGSNTLEVTSAVEQALAELHPLLQAQGVQVYPALHRPANFIENALDHVRLDLLIGAALIALVLMLFTRNWRAALISFVSIPLSLMGAIIVLDALGQTINTMTLGGLAVALGVVIDDAIIDVENIARRLRASPPGAPEIDTVVSASLEVRAPVVYATFVLIAVVTPILFLSSLAGAFVRPLAFAFILATLASLLVALTVTPALAVLLLRKTRLNEEPPFLHRLKDVHGRLLQRVCGRPGRVLAATAVVGLATLASFFFFGAELLPTSQERHFVMHVNGPPGASFEWMRSVGAKIAHDVLAIPGVATVEQQIGRAEGGEDTWPPNRSEFHVELAHVNAAAEGRIREQIRHVLAAYPVQSDVLTFLGERIGESLSGETAAVAIGIYGPNLNVLDHVAGDVAATLNRVPGAADVQIASEPGAPALQTHFDPQQLALHGLTRTDAADAVESAFQGQVVAQVADGQRFTDVAVLVPSNAQRDPEALGNIQVAGADAATPFADLADVRQTEARVSIVHDGGRRVQFVTANPTTSNVAGFVSSAEAAITQHVHLPPGVYLEYSGEAESEAAASRQLLMNVFVASIGVIVLLVLAFGGGRAAALILVGTPFALAGGAIAVALGGGVLALGALVGFVALFGIAARNAILLVSHTDHLVAVEGDPWGRDVVFRAARERLTPILMTALVTALGLLPLVVGAGGAGREVDSPMAVVILGGLVTSTAMTLLLLPALVLGFRTADGSSDR